VGSLAVLADIAAGGSLTTRQIRTSKADKIKVGNMSEEGHVVKRVSSC
jgi:hypothetical protein